MNILIEDIESLKYLTENSVWVANPAEGKIFESVKTAMAIAKREPINKFNVVGFIRESKQLVNIDSGRGQGHA